MGDLSRGSDQVRPPDWPIPSSLLLQMHFRMTSPIPRILCLLLLLSTAMPVSAHGGLPQKIASFSWQLEQRPGDADLLLARGELHRLAGHWDEALADYAAARVSRPTLVPVLESCRAQLELDRGDAQAAIDATTRALPNHPAPGSVLLLRARAQERLGRALPAAACYRAALLALADPTPQDVHDAADALRRVPDLGPELALACVEWGLRRLGPCATLELKAVELETAAGQYDAALLRIDNGEYGECLNCGEDIAPKRLELDPANPVCIDCAV